MGKLLDLDALVASASQTSKAGEERAERTGGSKNLTHSHTQTHTHETGGDGDELVQEGEGE